MPIQLDTLASTMASTPVKLFTPKFFSSKLTGSGKKIGLLNENRNPVYIDPAVSTKNENIYCKKHSYTNGNTTITMIPLSILIPDAIFSVAEVLTPDINEMAKVATIKQKSGNDLSVYVHMTAHSLILEEIKEKDNSTKRVLTPCYCMETYVLGDKIPKRCKQLRSNAMQKNTMRYDFTCNPKVLYDTAIKAIINYTGNYYSGCNIDDKAFYDYLANYSLYDGIVERAKEWQTTADVILDEFFEQKGKANSGNTDRDVNYVVKHIENYNIPLDLYRNIYASIIKHFNTDDAKELCKQNLNLLLSDTLGDLEQNKPNLTKFPTLNTPPAVPAQFSREQVNAITSTDPLILVQAGAGTGKSTTIRGRINYMIDCGIDPKDITVLSFTNAAADHISEICPDIHSMTIARMIHTIYTENFTDHELSSIETIINSLDIYFPSNDFAYNFKNKLYKIIKNEPSAFTTMNNFVENHYDEVINVLNTIRQTSLELEIIICYQQIENFNEPAEVASKYLIIDEVQDNSIFEFIYTLKYVDKHNEALFIVGDCSQTLYEFRASNPKALNILEGSGVFSAYQLQTNYRSNQEILDFANITLQNIEANQYANIRLRANNISAKVTEKSFTEKVKLDYHKVRKVSDFGDALGGYIAKDVKPYIDAKLAAGEQVAFLAFTRNNVNRIQKSLETLYPDKKIASLVPDKMYNTTIFSSFIKDYWDEVKFIPTKNIMYTIGHTITQHLDRLTYDKDKALNPTQKLLASWYDEQGPIVMSWQNQHLAGTMTLDDMLMNIRENMLQFEIKNNAIKQALLSAKNEANKNIQNANDANFILSTIHSAKGLEFDNVVIIYAHNNTSEEEKRMYYVAFTRAMKSEYILAYDTVVQPKIVGDYEHIVKMLHDKENPATQSNNTGTPTVNVDETLKGYAENIKKTAEAMKKRDKKKASK